jgi:2-polyprenyl-3-methyl-5-hydroxy-6-metoxy-1,4-benzoquinol methylase
MERHDYPYDSYKKDYYNRPESVHAIPILKVQDELAAFAYAFGVESYDEYSKLLGLSHQDQIGQFVGNGRLCGDKVINHLNYVGLWDSIVPKHEDIQLQLQQVLPSEKRKPKCVLDWGSGNGLLSAAFSHFDVTTYAVDPNPSKEVNGLNTSNRIDKAFVEDLTLKEIENIDTVIFCESIEHMPEEYVNHYLKLISTIADKDILVIQVNTINYHPINPSPPDHITRINNAFQQRFIDIHNIEVIFKQGSHIVGTMKKQEG